MSLDCAAPRSVSPSFRLREWISMMFAAHQQRRALCRLSDELLADIGVTRAEARAEACRAAWDVPANWRR